MFLVTATTSSDVFGEDKLSTSAKFDQEFGWF